MAGIGKYTKGEKFELKSGNSPVFKMMGTPESGDSPITNEFGIGKGTSPYQQEEEKEESKFMQGLKKVGKIGVAALTGGLDAVYGSGKVIASSSDRLKKDTKKKVCYAEDGTTVIACP